VDRDSPQPAFHLLFYPTPEISFFFRPCFTRIIYFLTIIKSRVMKKTLLFVCGLLFILFFTSCSKENTQPNNEKKASTNQPSSSQEAPPPSTPASGCPQAPPAGCPHAPANPPVNPMNPMGY
jgi:hypothetical protein